MKTKEEAVIEQYELLIYKVAKKFYNVELADLFQAGCVGLIKANRNFREEENTNFMSFAYKYIFGEMYELANKSRDIKLNKEYLKLFKAIEQARSFLTQKLGKDPNLTDICLYLEIEEALASDVISLTSKMISLDYEYESLNNEVKVMDKLGSEDNTFDQILVNDSLKSLEPIEQSVIDYRYFHDLTQTETANVLGISQVKVSRLESQSKKKIKEYIAA